MAGVTFKTTITFSTHGKNTYASCVVDQAAVKRLGLGTRDKFRARLRGLEFPVTVYTGGGRKVFLIPMRIVNSLALAEGMTITVTLERPR